MCRVRRSGCRLRGWRRRRQRSLTSERQGRVEGRVARPVGSGEGEEEVGRTERGVASSETSGERCDLLRSGERPPHFLLATRFSPLPTHPRHFPLVSPLATGLATRHWSRHSPLVSPLATGLATRRWSRHSPLNSPLPFTRERAL